MISVLVMANDSLLADAIMTILRQEIDLDVVHVNRRELGSGDRRSVAIIIDEGDPLEEATKTADLFRDQSTFLVILISLKSQDIYIYESYQLANPSAERLVHIVREFARLNLKKSADEDGDGDLLKKMTSDASLEQGQQQDRQLQAHPARDSALATSQLSPNRYWKLFLYFILRYLRRKTRGNVTRILPEKMFSTARGGSK